MFRKFFATNQAAKIGSLLVAFGFWIFASATSSVNQSGFFPGTIPITINHAPTNSIATLSVDTVRIRISADAAVWRQLKNDSFSASIDLSSQTNGVTNVPVQVQVLAPDVQLLEISPQTVAVQIEAKVEKSATVQIQPQGEPAAGYFAADATSDPTSVSASGPASQMERLDHVAAVIDVTGANSDREGTVEMQAIDASGHVLQNVDISPDKVKVTQHLTRLAATKSVGIQVVTTGTPQQGKIILPISTNPLTVMVAGSAQQLANLTSIPTNPVDISKITSRTTLKGSLNLPQGVTTSDSQDVQIIFDVADSSAAQAVNATLNFVNLPSNLHIVSADPASPQIVVSGAAAKLKSLASGDVSITVDLSGAVAGTRQITLSQAQVKLPDGISFQQFIANTLNLVID